MRTLLIYDISDDNKREHLREHVMNYGLRRVQYSGYLGEVNPHDRFVLSQEIGKYLSTDRDSIYVVPLCDRCVRLCKIVSRSRRFMEDDSIEIVS